MDMDPVMVASFMDELSKIAEGNVADLSKSLVGGMGANAVAKPLPGSGLGRPGTTPKPARSTNYSMVNSTEPRVAFDAGTEAKRIPPPPART